MSQIQFDEFSYIKSHFKWLFLCAMTDASSVIAIHFNTTYASMNKRNGISHNS